MWKRLAGSRDGSAALPSPRFSAVAIALAAVGGAGCSLLFRVDEVVSSGGGAVSEDGGRSEAAGDGFCAARPASALCDDFERADGPVDGRWSGLRQSGGGLAQLDGAESRSPARSLLATLAEGAEPAWAHLHWEDDATLRGWTLRYALYLPALPAGGSVVTTNSSGVRFDDGDGEVTCDVVADVGSGGMRIRQSLLKGGYPIVQSDHPMAVQPAAGRWADVVVRVDITTPPAPRGRVVVTVDGAVSVDVALLDKCLPGKPTVNVGVAYANPPPVFAMRVDDVALEIVR